MCQVQGVMCNVLHVTCHMSLTPTARATDPPPAKSPTMHSRMQSTYFGTAILHHFWAKIAKSETNVF